MKIVTVTDEQMAAGGPMTRIRLCVGRISRGQLVSLWIAKGRVN